MLNEITIEGFKSINKETLIFAPLTVLTGTNSSGKSTVIQALLLVSRFAVNPNRYSLAEITRPYSDVRDVRNRFINSQDINITLPINDNSGIKELGLSVKEQELGILFRGNVKPTSAMLERIANGDVDMSEPPMTLIYETPEVSGVDELFYLNASRTGPQDVAPIGEVKVGRLAEFLFGYFDAVKGEPLVDELVRFNGSSTLDYQVSQWLSQITNTVTELKTVKINSTQVKVTFNSDGLDNISASNLGAGMSYVSKVIILCLMAKRGDVVIIENPEIHLHPQAQAQLGVFFTFIANCGIQLIIETHCEHLINKIRHQVYLKEFAKDDVVIQYKQAVREPFIELNLDGNGRYIDKEENRVGFPSGFFDSTLNSLIEMGG
ncbi:MAG: putative ATPase [Moritella dasanensis]|jgi:predicted ATPase